MPEHLIPAPLPGTFYRRPAPDAAPYVAEGSPVEADTVIACIEVMKQFNEMTAGHGGQLMAFLVEDGEAVEIGQPVARVLT
ncbi:acetyl-CoA carboxylase [Aquitalea magnusonii]|uniref:Biotin carboxyl carrier protein of acetyl-CoA carboxylase n=1 Tax=Aquitalea magnusonii TaxID=332411 RepID=A0A318J577_9NEIS|nr:acetyl-CoA carboxylase [Aquitalea magnusonii]PXX42290.1 biotin carboxyl carrier protein [Aquitalea magnusonii]